MENINEISLTEGCNILSHKFENEKEFVLSLIPKLNDIIKGMYGYTVKRYQTERHYKNLELGYFNAFIDIYVETEEGVDIVIECKNPRQIKAETFAAFGQIMSYEFLLEKVHGTEKQIKYIIATSKFDFVFFQFMKRFNLKYDVILNTENAAGFWVNDF
jgi:hypothetical protein